MKKQNSLLGAGVLTAITASLCCITPVLAIIAGSSGIAASFSWLEPFRPYLIGLTVLVLGFAWYQKLKPKKEVECDCEEKKPKFMQTRLFLGIVTGFALVMLVFPFYADIFYPKQDKKTTEFEISNIQFVEIPIDGMTCNSCELHVNHEVSKLSGVVSSEASFKEGNAIIEYDISKIDVADIHEAINKTGYSVKDN
jgi:copper chaperone CopZ